MHFKNATYDALVQQWANAVRLMRRSVHCAASSEHSAGLRLRLGWPPLATGAECAPAAGALDTQPTAGLQAPHEARQLEERAALLGDARRR